MQFSTEYTTISLFLHFTGSVYLFTYDRNESVHIFARLSIKNGVPENLHFSCSASRETETSFEPRIEQEIKT